MRTGSKFFAAGLLTTLMCGSAYAADVIMEEPPAPMAVETSSVYDWNGLYIGVSGGYISPQINLSGIAGNSVDYGEDGFLVGGTIGYNVQYGNFVFGVEGDISYADIDGTIDGANDPFGFGFQTTAEADYLATVRGRVGYAFDRLLVYGTGGLAFTDLEVQTPGGTADSDDTGYTVGGGVEYAFTNNLTTKIEYLYADFGSASSPVLGGFDAVTDLDMHIVRVGLNYKF